MIRPATEADIPEIVRMGRLFWSQAPMSQITFCPDSLAFMCREMMKLDLLLIAEVDGNVAGSVGAIVSPLYVNRDVLVASELFWWVEPEYRNSGVGKEMLAAIESSVKSVGVSVFSMMALETVEPERAAAIYQRLGYKPTERAYAKVL